MTIQAFRSESTSIAHLPEVQRADQALAALENTADQIKQLIAANNGVPSSASRQLLDIADIEGREITSPNTRVLLQQQLAASGRSSIQIQQLIGGNNGVPSSPKDNSSHLAKVMEFFETARLLAIEEDGLFEIRRIDLADSGIPSYLHERVESVIGNATLQRARNVLIRDTNHSDVVHQANIIYFVRQCMEDGNVLLREGYPMGRAFPPQDTYFEDCESRDERGITETGWDDMEFYYHCLDHVNLVESCSKKIEKLNATFEKLHPEDRSLTPQGDDKAVLEAQFNQLDAEVDVLNKKISENEPFYNASCRVRDGALESTFKRHYDAGKKVWGVAGASHISSALVDRIHERRVIVVTLKGSKSVDAGDGKQAT